MHRSSSTVKTYCSSTMIDVSPSHASVAPLFRLTCTVTLCAPFAGTLISDWRTVPSHVQSPVLGAVQRANCVPLFGWAWIPSTRIVTLSHDSEGPSTPHRSEERRVGKECR